MNIKQYEDMIYACGRCEMCRGQDFGERCPELYTQFWESSTARGRMAIARAILEGKMQYTEELAERIFGCFMCGRCREECKKAAGIDIIAITQAMRQDFVEAGVKIPQAADQMAQSILETGNIFNDTPEDHVAWAESLEFEEGSGVLFFPGCLASHRFKEKTATLVKMLQAAGYKLDFLGKEQACCGTPFWVTGHMEKAREWAEKTVAKYKERGVHTIITPCPSCYRAFKEVYPQILGVDELPFEVRHSSEVLEDIVREKKLDLKHEVNVVLTYHDPCEIGRYHGIYEPPREVLKAVPGVELREMPRNRAEAFCCGGGGGVKLTYPEKSEKVAVARLEEALGTGASVVTTACPACELNLTHAVYAKDAEVRVLDIAEILAVSAGIVDEEILDPYYIPED
ncbi:MAG: (Fe-S)-binding protein [Candidatus Thorarchaeota archaeon]